MWATPSDVIDSWIGDDEPTDESKIQLWIDRAERLIRSEMPNISDRIGSGEDPDLVDNVRDVIVSMVTRVFRNPFGYRSVTGTTTSGPHSDSESRTFGGDTPGTLEILDTERDLLAGRQPGAGAAFSVDLLAGHDQSVRGPQWWLAHGKQSEL